MIIYAKCGQKRILESTELEREVLVTHLPRMSITGWLKVKAN